MEQPPKRLSLSLLFLRDSSLERGDCVGELTGFSHTADRVAGPVNETPGGEVVVRGLDERFRSGRILPPRCQPAGQPHRHSQPLCFARAGVSEIVFLHPISRLKHRFDRGGLARGCRRKCSHGRGKGAQPLGEPEWQDRAGMGKLGCIEFVEKFFGPGVKPSTLLRVTEFCADQRGRLAGHSVQQRSRPASAAEMGRFEHAE